MRARPPLAARGGGAAAARRDEREGRERGGSRAPNRVAADRGVAGMAGRRRRAPTAARRTAGGVSTSLSNLRAAAVAPRGGGGQVRAAAPVAHVEDGWGEGGGRGVARQRGVVPEGRVPPLPSFLRRSPSPALPQPSPSPPLCQYAPARAPPPAATRPAPPPPHPPGHSTTCPCQGVAFCGGPHAAAVAGTLPRVAGRPSGMRKPEETRRGGGAAPPAEGEGGDRACNLGRCHAPWPCNTAAATRGGGKGGDQRPAPRRYRLPTWHDGAGAAAARRGLGNERGWGGEGAARAPPTAAVAMWPRRGGSSGRDSGSVGGCGGRGGGAGSGGGGDVGGSSGSGSG